MNENVAAWLKDWTLEMKEYLFSFRQSYVSGGHANLSRCWSKQRSMIQLERSLSKRREPKWFLKLTLYCISLYHLCSMMHSPYEIQLISHLVFHVDHHKLLLVLRSPLMLGSSLEVASSVSLIPLRYQLHILHAVDYTENNKNVI